MAGRIVIAPHGDDETFGSGGTILKSKASAWYACSREDKPYAAVQSMLKIPSFDCLDFPDSRFDELPFGKIVEKISEIIQEWKPDSVLMPFYGDAHSDHRIIANAILAACKPFRAPFVKTLLMYEVLSETNLASIMFSPNYYVDITNTIDMKMAASKLYADEFTNGRNLEQLWALALVRGAECGVKYAEAFQTVRIVR